ncbi:MAG TPA: ribonuclease H-like domain-containing protein [Methanocella sp.]|nr:ribonuclease H-like domain-containing protein [Methanocella sp.]
MQVKKRYLDRFHGIPLEEAIPGKPVSNEFGECYSINSTSEFAQVRIERAHARKALLSSLRLLHGIGPEKEEKLKVSGYRTIEDLIGHPVWGKKAGRFLGLVEAGDPVPLQEEVWRWLPKSHPLNLHIMAFTDMGKLTLIDIETMGLFSRPIILFGAALVENGNIQMVQYLARSIEEEAAAIEAFCTQISDAPIISYNGRSFDVPYVNQRRWFYDMKGEIGNVHFDMLHFARRAFRDRVPDARLITIEKYLFGRNRTEDVPSAMVPEFYDSYLNTGNPGPLVPIVEHNMQDLITLANVFNALCKEELKHVCD